jgi:uncharacterized protein (DUF433 family)
VTRAIVQTAGVLGGKPRLDGTRIGVATIASCHASGWSVETIAEQYPALTENDVRAALAWHDAHGPEEAALEVDVLARARALLADRLELERVAGGGRTAMDGAYAVLRYLTKAEAPSSPSERPRAPSSDPPHGGGAE